MVVDGGRALFVQQRKATNGCEEGHNHRRDLTKGEFHYPHILKQLYSHLQSSLTEP